MHGEATRSAALIEKGEEAVQTATDAIARQVVLLAARISRVIESEAVAGVAGLESVQLSFGITLTAGVQALFTAQSTSSVQVTLTFASVKDRAGHGGA
jgi:hypothetical protein